MSETELVLVATEGETYHLAKRQQNRSVVRESVCGAIDADSAQTVAKAVAREDGRRACQHCLTARNREARTTSRDDRRRGEPPTSLSDSRSWGDTS